MTVPQYLEDQILADNRARALAQLEADQKYTRGNWGVVANLLSAWGDQAPTLPPDRTTRTARATQPSVRAPARNGCVHAERSSAV